MSQNNKKDRAEFLACNPYSHTVSLCLDRWKPFIIRGVEYDGKTRFSKFAKQLPITDKVLTDKLKELEQDGIIERRAYPEIPPHVEYLLTDYGKEICRLLDVVYDIGWKSMKAKGMEIDPIGEMWHGYRPWDNTLTDID